MTLDFAHADIWVAAALAVVAAAVFWQYSSLRTRLGRGRAFLVTSIRSALFLLLLIFLSDPVILRERRESFRPAISVGLDGSMSMGISGGRDTTRIERAMEFLASPHFEEALGEYYADFFTFDEKTREIGRHEISSVSTDGRWTDIGLAVADGAEGKSTGALVLLTDSSHDRDLIYRTLDESATPVILVTVDGGEEERDVEIFDVEAADIAFTGRPVELTVKVRGSGFAGKELPIVLKEGGKVVSSTYLSFEGDREERSLALSWSPPGAGRYHLTVEIPPQAGEEVSLNNAVHLPIEVRRDKIRILLVSGRPSWNYRFIREALKGDPTVDLISFIILRSANDIVNVPQDELSLIPFPTRKIFLEELENFDLIIFENFSFRFYFPQQYLDKTAEFVEKGGGFWMLGGPLSFAGGGYAGTSLGEVLPVNVKNVPLDSGYDAASFRAAVTPGGQRHPLLRGLDSRDYDSLPPLEGFNRTSGLKEQAVVLLEHAEGAGPLLAIGRHGAGRSLALMSDSIWKWNFEMAGSGKGKTFFLSLLRQAVRWTVGDPLMEPVRVTLQKDHLMTGDDLRGTVKAFSEDFVPAKDPAISVELRGENEMISVLPLERVADGLFSFNVPAPPVGTYEIRASVMKGADVYGRDTAALRVSWPGGELRSDNEISGNLPRDLSAKGHGVIKLGAYESTARLLKEALVRSAPPYRILTEEKRGLGEEWWAFVAAFGLLAAEWLLRRRFSVE